MRARCVALFTFSVVLAGCAGETPGEPDQIAGSTQALSASDLESLSLLALLEATRSAQLDVRAIQAQIAATNAQKMALRKQILELQQAGVSVNGLKAQLETMNELGDTQSLRLQMDLDQHTKLMQALSNALKKFLDSQRAIVGSVK